jgi:hypothetical protein
MTYDIIILSQADIDYIANRAVICSTYLGAALFEPIPDAMLEYFSNHTRVQYNADWHYPTHPIRLNVNKKLLTIDMRESNDIADLVNYALNDANIKQHIIDTAEADTLYIYLNFLLEDHRAIIEASDTITIELLPQ